MRSQLPVNTVLLSAEKATLVAQAACACKEAVSLPSAGFHKCRAPSPPTEASSLPSAEKAMEVTVLVCATSVARTSPLARSQRRTSLGMGGSSIASVPAASVLPSGEKATLKMRAGLALKTASSGLSLAGAFAVFAGKPLRVVFSCPVAGFQILTVASKLPEANCKPSCV